MSKIDKEFLQSELKDILETNETIKSAALMVGYDVDSETDRILKSVDNRVRVNLHQRGRINTLKSLIEDLEV